MPTFYNFTQDGLIYSFDDVFIPADLFREGTLWTWGSGTNGRLGNADTADRSTPVTVFSGGTNWKQVSSGGSHAAAIKTDGTLWTWGSGTNGKLGNGITTETISTPSTTFSGGTNWRQVSSGLSHTAAIKTDGTLWTWGLGNNGQLGRVVPNKSTPVTTFAGGTNWSDVASTEPEDLYTISAGSAHTAAIKTDGTLWTWGLGNNGRLGNNSATLIISTPITTFAGGTNWKQVSSGETNTAAIKTDGTLWTWGSIGISATFSVSPITTFSGGTDWKQVSTGARHTAAIKTDGTLWIWGLSNYAKLGNGLTVGDRSTPITTFAGGTDWKHVSCTNNFTHTAAIKTDGTLWIWGRPVNGRLGNAVISGDRSTPVTTFAGGTNWKQVSCGGAHNAAIKTDGTLWTWGYGNNGRLGNGLVGANISTPVTTFSGGTNWKQVSCGRSHTAAIKTDGTLWTWGYGNRGQLGNSVTTDRSTPVTTFSGGTDWKQVICGDDHTVALKDTGGNKELYLFGTNSFGALGEGNFFDDFFPNQITTGGTNWKQVSSGGAHTAAVKTDGTLWTWGSCINGRLGNGVATATTLSTPITTFSGGTNWKQVSSGGSHTAAIKTDGTLWTWGNGLNGRLGNAVTVDRSTPVTTFSGGTNWKQVSCGDNYTAAVKTDGTLWTWGNGTNGRLGNGVTTGNISTPVTTFAGGTDWKQVSSQTTHTTAVKTDGTIWTWGDGTNGKLGNNATTGDISTPVTTFAGGTNWKQVSSGGSHTTALTYEDPTL
jgi:alpha-tubulin suppressor-like RCC1 family protein